MKKVYQEPVLEVIQLNIQTYLLDTSYMDGPGASPSLDDPESMFPYVILGKE